MNGRRTPIIGGAGQLDELNKAEIDAQNDAQLLARDSPVIKKLIGAEVLLNRLLFTFRNAMLNEMKNGWEIENPTLVVDAISKGIFNQAFYSEMTLADMRSSVLLELLPLVDIFCVMEKERNEQQADVLPGDDAGATPDVGELPGRTDSNQEHQGGQCAEGDRRETEEAGS